MSEGTGSKVTKVGSYILSDAGFRSRYIEAVSLSLKKEDCAEIAGCTSETVREWLKLADATRASGHTDEYTEFQDQINAAIADRKHTLMVRAGAMAHDSDKPSWPALRFLLARDDYFDPAIAHKVEGGDNDKPIHLHFDKQDERA